MEKKMQQREFYENVQQRQVQRQIVHHNWEKITLKSGAKFDAKSSFCCSDCPYNAENVKPKWFGIFQDKSNNVVKCTMNIKNKPNYQLVYQAQTMSQRNQKGRDFRNNDQQNNDYNRQGGYNGQGRYKNN